MQQDDKTVGFAQYVMTEKEGLADVVVWGKWVNTLMYIAIKAGFEHLGLQVVRSAVRVDNKRVMKTYQRLGIRSTGRELTPVRTGGFLSAISMVGFQYFEMTREEFDLKSEELRQQSLEIELIGA
jgi:RimJ/RimL family protein N-acetyltransferase